MLVVRAIRVIAMVIYASYLTNIGLLLLLLPWSEGWTRFVLLVPTGVAMILDAPVFRGMVSAFGFLHLALLIGELLSPPGPRHGGSPISGDRNGVNSLYGGTGSHRR